MTTPLSKFPKPNPEKYRGHRKLFLAPMFAFPPQVPQEGHDLLDRYWTEVKDHINNLERSLTTVSHVYHESLFANGDEGMELLNQINPKAYSFIEEMCKSTATLEATEDKDLFAENSDWHRCLTIGLSSEKVLNLAVQNLQETTQKRFESIGKLIDETLKEDEAGVLFISENHNIQFPNDIQVFYVAPPTLDTLKKWINDQMRSKTPNSQESTEPE